MSNKTNEFLAQYGHSGHLDNLVNHSNENIRNGVARNPTATKEHLDKLINDNDHYVRSNVVLNKNATKEHLDKLINDPIEYVRAYAEDKLASRFPK